jgi:maltose O-acetyltransferase
VVRKEQSSAGNVLMTRPGEHPATQDTRVAAIGAGMARVLHLLSDDLQVLRPRLLLVTILMGLMPGSTLSWLRPSLYRLAGARIGSRTRIFGKITVTGQGHVTGNVRMGEGCIITTPLYLNASAPITIGNSVSIGHHVVIITDSHWISDPLRRAGERFARPVTIEDGVWIAARATILPGVTLGRGSVVSAGAVVAKDVPPNTLVAGVPARVLKTLPTSA